MKDKKADALINVSNIDSTLLVRPLYSASIISVVYLIASAVYVLFSGEIAAHSCRSLIELESIERVNDFAFVGITTVLLFVLCLCNSKRIAEHEKALVKYQDHVIVAERKAAAGLFASSVAHDINNVLMIVEYATHMLKSRKKNGNEEILKKLRQANSNLQKLTRILGKAGGYNLENTEEDFDLAVAIRETVEVSRAHQKIRFCNLEIETPDTLPFRGKSILIHQLLLNLIINAADATNCSGTIVVKLMDSDYEAVIEVHDNGPGIPESQRETIMEPFFTTKEDGSGLGLLSVKVCVVAHQGSVRIIESHLGGACFEIRLANPLYQSTFQSP